MTSTTTPLSAGEGSKQPIPGSLAAAPIHDSALPSSSSSSSSEVHTTAAGHSSRGTTIKLSKRPRPSLGLDNNPISQPQPSSSSSGIASPAPAAGPSSPSPSRPRPRRSEVHKSVSYAESEEDELEEDKIQAARLAVQAAMRATTLASSPGGGRGAEPAGPSSSGGQASLPSSAHSSLPSSHSHTNGNAVKTAASPVAHQAATSSVPLNHTNAASSLKQPSTPPLPSSSKLSSSALAKIVAAAGLATSLAGSRPSQTLGASTSAAAVNNGAMSSKVKLPRRESTFITSRDYAPHANAGLEYTDPSSMPAKEGGMKRADNRPAKVRIARITVLGSA